MNKLACRVMVAFAGMAVLGMTATLAGAQTHPATHTLNDAMQAPFASDMLAGPMGFVRLRGLISYGSSYRSCYERDRNYLA